MIEHMQLDKDKKNFVLSALLNNLFISGNMTFKEAVMRFNANVSYSGLLHAVTQDVGYTFVCWMPLNLIYFTLFPWWINIMITASKITKADSNFNR